MHYKINNCHFLFYNHIYKINNKAVDYPEKTLQVLKIFLQSENKTVSKEQIITELWGDVIVTDDSLFKVIQALRKVFKTHGLTDDVLVNVYGKGYKIKTPIEFINNCEVNKDQVQERVKNINRKYYLLGLTALVFTLIGLYFYNSQSANTIIGEHEYTNHIEKINKNPNKFLSSINESIKSKNLNITSQVNLNSLKAYAHFILGQYPKAFSYYEKAIALADGKKLLSIADNYLYMSKIYYYRADEINSSKYINLAYDYYRHLNNQDGIFNCSYIFLNILHLEKNYEQEVSQAQVWYDKADKLNHSIGKIYALMHFYFGNTSLGNNVDAKKYITQALEIALKAGDSKFISLCYGLLAQDSLEQGDFVSAMKWANITLKNAVVQANINRFMQGFSYMYNVLSPLGYDQLAETYLQKGINLQNHLNSDGHLHVAEINLGVIKIKLKKYKQAQVIFSQLLNYKLSVLERLEAKAWMALNYAKLHDNISAYSLAITTYKDLNNTPKIKFIAGIALMISASELERFDEADNVFNQITELANDDWLIAYKFYLDSVISQIKENDKETKITFNQKLLAFQAKQTKIKSQAKPDRKTLKELDKYLAKIFD